MRPKRHSWLTFFLGIQQWIEDKRSQTFNAPQIPQHDLICDNCNTLCIDKATYIQACSHIVCENCYGDINFRENEDGLRVSFQNPLDTMLCSTYKLQQAPCPKCDETFRADETNDEEPAPASASAPTPQPKAKSRSKGKRKSRVDKKGKGNVNKEEGRGEDDWGFRHSIGSDPYSRLQMQRFDEGSDFFESSKLAYTVKAAVHYHNKNEEDKIVIFSQFRHAALIIGQMLKKHGIKFLYFTVSPSIPLAEPSLIPKGGATHRSSRGCPRGDEG